MGDLVDHFYSGTLADRGYSIRIDILLVYDLDQLEVPMQWTGRQFVPPTIPPTESYTFNFKDPNQKQRALLGIIRILR